MRFIFLKGEGVIMYCNIVHLMTTCTFSLIQFENLANVREINHYSEKGTQVASFTMK